MPESSVILCDNVRFVFNRKDFFYLFIYLFIYNWLVYLCYDILLNYFIINIQTNP